MTKVAVITQDIVFSGTCLDDLTKKSSTSKLGVSLPKLMAPYPVCTRYISPYFTPYDSQGNLKSPRSIIIVENRPQIMDVTLGDTHKKIALPWHSFIFTISDKTKVTKVQLLFSATALNDEEVRLYTPYIPGVYFNTRPESIGHCYLDPEIPVQVPLDHYGNLSKWYDSFYVAFWFYQFDSNLDKSLRNYSTFKVDEPASLPNIYSVLEQLTLDDVLDDSFYAGVESITFEDISTMVVSGLNSSVLSFMEKA